MAQSEKKVKKVVSLDDIFVKEVGQFGLFQIKVMLLATVVAIFNAICLNEFVFTAATIDTRCKIPGCDDVESEFSQSWILNAVPGTSIESFEDCTRYVNSTDIITTKNNTCPASFFLQNETMDCDNGYVYSNSYTVVKDFDLGCQEWKRAAIGTYDNLGAVVGHFLTGFLSDRWGRKTALIVNAFNAAWLGVLRYWAKSYLGFVMLEVIEAAFGTGSYSCAYILVTEFAGPKYRTFAGCSMNVMFAMGQIVLALVARAVPYWRHMTLALYIPQIFVAIMYIWMLPESIRWLLSNGKYKNAEKVLKSAAKINRRTISETSLNALLSNFEKEKLKNDATTESDKQEWLPVLVLRHKAILLRCIITPFWFFTAIFVASVLNYNAVSLNGDKYVNYIFVQTMTIPSAYFTAFLTMKFGRKKILLVAFWACAAFQFAYIFVPLEANAVSMAMYLMSKLFSAMVNATTFIYTSELYPTPHRQTLFSLSYIFGRIGSVVAPLTPALSTTVWYYLPSVMYIALAFAAGLLTFLTPETHGVKLPDTMQEAADMGKNKNVKK